MLLIPQLYLKNGRTVPLANNRNLLFADDPLLMARNLKQSGVQAVYVTDLAIPHVGPSPHLSLIKKIREDVELAVFVGGSFRSLQAVEPFLKIGVELLVMDAIAYQQPELVKQTCALAPGKIGVHIDVKGGKVTIPGWTVAANKSAADYLERFKAAGVGVVFYSDVDEAGNLSDANFKSTAHFCRAADLRVVVTSEITGLADIERLVALEYSRMEGMLLNRSFYEGRIDITGAAAFIAELLFSKEHDTTLLDEER